MTQNSVSSDAVRLFHESIAAEQRKDFAHSYQLLQASINEDPTLPGAWNNLGVRLHEQRKWAASAAAFYRAHLLAPDQTLMLANYAWNLHHAGRKEESLPIMKKVLEKEPNNIKHYINFSQINLSLNNVEEALAAAQKALSLNPNESMAQLSLGLAQLRSGDYYNGLRNYEARFPYVPVLAEYLKYPYPMWRGEDISRQTLFIACEQGLGDAVMFMRFIPEAVKRARKTIVYVHDNAFKLFKRNLPASVEIHPIPKELPAADVFCPLLSLPVALGLTNEQITSSYLEYKVPDPPVQLPKTKEFKVGICWAGDPNHDNDKARSATLEDMLMLAEVPNVQLYSLQVGERAKDTDLCGTHSIVKSLTPYLKSVSDTISIIKTGLDAVVSVDTAVAHMAASVGVKTFILIAKHGVDWRWGHSGCGNTVWYPNARLVNQDREGEWRSPLGVVMYELERNCQR